MIDGSSPEAVRWQYETFSAGCCAGTGGAVVVVWGADAVVVVDGVDGGAVVVVDEDDETVVVVGDVVAVVVGVVVVCAPAGAGTNHRPRKATTATPTNEVRRIDAPYALRSRLLTERGLPAGCRRTEQGIRRCNPSGPKVTRGHWRPPICRQIVRQPPATMCRRPGLVRHRVQDCPPRRASGTQPEDAISRLGRNGARATQSSTLGTFDG